MESSTGEVEASRDKLWEKVTSAQRQGFVWEDLCVRSEMLILIPFHVKLIYKGKSNVIITFLSRVYFNDFVLPWVLNNCGRIFSVN